MRHTDTETSERTTISLPRSLARRLMVEARASGKSVSGLIREALEAFFGKQPRPRLPSFAGVGRSGRRDVSERAEELIGARVRRGRKR